MHRIFVGVMLIAALGGGVAAQSPPYTNGAILDELRQIRHLLEKLTRRSGAGTTSRTVRRIELPVPTATLIGHADAPLTIVEFTDLQCPFCRHFYATTFEQLKTAYIDTHNFAISAATFPGRNPSAREDRGKSREMRRKAGPVLGDASRHSEEQRGADTRGLRAAGLKRCGSMRLKFTSCVDDPNNLP